MSGVQYSATFRHGPVSGPVNGFLGAVVLALFGRTWNKVWEFWSWWRDAFPPFPSYAPLIVAALGCIAAVLVGLRRETDTKNIAFRVVCWLAAGAWSTYTINAGFSWVSFGCLAGAAVFAGLLVPGFGTYQPPQVQFQLQPGAVDFEAELLENIVQFCNLKPHERPSLRKVRDWDRNAGFTYMVTGARGSRFTWRKLRDIQADLAAAMQLDEGCPVQAEAGGTHQGAALLHISTKNYMREPIDYPRDYSPLSIENEFSVGRFLDGAPTLIELKQAAGLAAGQRGGGKTVLLQNITASLVRCVDVVVWHVDLNGGGMSAPWTMPFALGEIDTPAVDWVATTPRQALKMARVALRIAKDRKRSYQRLLIQKGVDVLPVTRELPLIMIIVDEAAEVTGETAVKEAQAVSKALQEVQRIGRAMCVNVFFSTQRATGDYLPAQIKKGASVAFCTRVKDEAELAHVFDWHRGIDPENLTEPGQMYIQRNTRAVKMFKGYRLLPPQIIECVHQTQTIRTAVKVDRRAVAMGGETYRLRWEDEDSQTFLAGLRGDLDEDDDFGSFDDDGESVDAHDNDEVPDDGVTTFRNAMAALRAETQAAMRKQQNTGQPAEPPQAPAPQLPAQPSAHPAQSPPQPPAVQAEQQPVAQQTPPPAGSPGGLSSTDEQQFMAWLEDLPETPEPPAAPPSAPPRPVGLEPVGEDQFGPEPRRAFIVQFVQSAGDRGRRTQDVIAAVKGVGFTHRDETVKDDLGVLKKAGRLTQNHQGKAVYGRWFDRDYGLDQP